MKRWVKSATNTCNIPAKPVFSADEELEVEEAPTLDDRLSELKDDFSLLQDQLEYQGDAEALRLADRIQDSVEEFIAEAAGNIAE